MGRKKAAGGSVRNRNAQNVALSNSAKTAPQIYRDSSKIGQALQNVTVKLSAEGKIKNTLQSHIMNMFDEKISEGLKKLMEESKKPLVPPLIFTAETYTCYNVIDGIFNVKLKKVTLDPYKNPKKLKKLDIRAFNYADNSLNQMVKDKALSSSTALVVRKK